MIQPLASAGTHRDIRNVRLFGHTISSGGFDNINALGPRLVRTMPRETRMNKRTNPHTAESREA